MGWIGTKGQLVYALRTFGADQEPNGDIRWWGNPPSMFLGMDTEDTDTVVDDTAEVEIGGKRVPVCSLLQDTSYGVKVTVL
jgi:hypothetical protein